MLRPMGRDAGQTATYLIVGLSGEHVASALLQESSLCWHQRCTTAITQSPRSYPDFQAFSSLSSNHSPPFYYLCHQLGEGDCVNGSDFSIETLTSLVSKDVWHPLVGFLEFCPVAMSKPGGLRIAA